MFENNAVFFFWKRREWLQEALSSITEDTYVKTMMTHLQTIDKPENDDDDILSEKEDAFEGLADIVDNLDNANGVFWFTVWGLGGGGVSMFILNEGNNISRKDKIELGRVFIAPQYVF